MSIKNLSSIQLNKLIKLVAEKEKHIAKILKIDELLARLEAGVAAATGPLKTSRGRKAGGRRSGGRKTKLKSGILAELKAAGAKGISVADLSKKLKTKPNNVFSWFYTTGRKVKGIKKVGPARYALVG
jgi:hypothetical protein